MSRGSRRSAGGAADDKEARGTAAAVAADPEQAARTIGLRQLATQPRTRAELARVLRRRGVPETVATEVLDRFEATGLIDDRVFARSWVESRHAGRGLARRALSQELRRRGVAGRTVDEAVAELDPDTERETARRLVARKLAATRGLDTTVRIRRMTAMLARKGYPAGLAVGVVREALERAGETAAAEEFTERMAAEED